MQGIPLDNVIPPDTPVGGKRRCKKCKEYLEVTENFSCASHRLANGKVKQYWRSRCKECTNNARQGKNTTTWWPEEDRARTRALTRLVRIVPRLFLPLFKEELIKEYKKKGLTEEELQRRLEYRTRYVNYYIRRSDG